MSASAPADSFVPNASKGFFVYIVRCADGSLYIGHAQDVEDRIKNHNLGRGATWTACRLPVELVYQEVHSSEQRAVARERQLKRWTQAKKLALSNSLFIPVTSRDPR